jgi:glyoxalase family protein
MTFFPFPHAAQGKRGNGEVNAVAWHVPSASLDYWITRLSAKGISLDGPSLRFGQQVVTFPDPDGMKIDLVFTDRSPVVVPWNQGPVPTDHQLRTFHGVTMALNDAVPSVALLSPVMGFRSVGVESVRQRYAVGQGPATAYVDLVVKPDLGWARQSAGSVHHIAWRVRNDEEQLAWRDRLLGAELRVTEVVDRQYFHSIYFREPGGILYEIATDPPGMNVDEDWDVLGQKLQLPPWYEPARARIEAALPALTLERRNL